LDLYPLLSQESPFSSITVFDENQPMDEKVFQGMGSILQALFC